MSVRAGLVITGTEVLSGRVQDRNGPWLADRLAELGIELAHVTITGDRPRDLGAALQFMRDEGARLVITSGGLGPTADDLTAQVVADFAGRPLQLDEALEKRIGEIIARFARRWRLDPEALEIANRKQAMVPEGAVALDPVGTAPGLVVPANGQVVVVLPGPPRELQGSWTQAVDTEPFRSVLADAVDYRQTTVRMFGIPESELAQTLRDAEEDFGFEGLEITTCLRRGELEIVIRAEPDSEPLARQLVERLGEVHGSSIFSTDGSTIDERIAQLLGKETMAVGESCTGGLLAGRLTDRPGASAYFAGGVVAYSNEAKESLLGVPPELIEAHGAVSGEVAEAMAKGAAERFGAAYGVAVTGIAGPDGGTPEKPVGRVCFAVAAAGENDATVRCIDIPGSRQDVRDRSVTVALHVLRLKLEGGDVPG
jgi:nicotinamide-nucleotide amidase